MHTTLSYKSANGRLRYTHLAGNQHLCRYASKPCFMPRVLKNTGELHRYCDHHRLQANRNQQRLERRRKLEEQTSEPRRNTSSSRDNTINKHTPELRPRSASPCSTGSDADGHEQEEEANPWMEQTSVIGSGAFEPFRHPVALRSEDLVILQAVFNEPWPYQHHPPADCEPTVVLEL